MSRAFLWSWLLSVPTVVLLRAWFNPAESVAVAWGLIALALWFFIGLAIWLIHAHRSNLHERLPPPVRQVFLGFKWTVIAWGAIGLAYTRIESWGLYPGLWFLLAPFVIPFVIELSRRLRRGPA